MSNFVRKILTILSPRERRQLYLLFIGMMVLAVIEVVGVGSIMPFMAVVANPDVVMTNKWLNFAYSLLGFTNPKRFLFFLGLIVLGFLIFSNAFTAFIQWAIFRFSWMRNYNIAKRLLIKYLAQPYIFFLDRNTSDLGKNILNEVEVVIREALLPLILLIKNVVLCLFIFGLLIFMNPVLAILVFLIIGGAYALFFLFINKKLKAIGIERAKANRQRFKIGIETLNGIKELKVLGRELAFLNSFSYHSKRLAKVQAIKNIYSQIPKYGLEIISFGGILIIVLYFLGINRDLEKVIPLISLYVFAAYKLMPSLQGIFSSFASIRYSLPALEILHNDIDKRSSDFDGYKKQWAKIKPLPIKNELQLKNVNFIYPGASEPVIKNLNLTIDINTTVGLVGATGCGKTTTIDIILGLLIPNDGCLLADEKKIKEENLRQWQKNLGYVPQYIFLTDDSVAKNIAFGIEEKEIDMEAVESAAKIANLHDFIKQDLPNGYKSYIGEKGIRLSGGQRQRIGIARALYHSPKVLILDEATSALDGITENMVMEAIQNLTRQKTIIIIAHRLSTVKKCDVIYLMENGKIISEGKYFDLLNTNQKFQNMARVGMVE